MKGRHAMRRNLRDQWPWLVLVLAFVLVVLILLAV